MLSPLIDGLAIGLIVGAFMAVFGAFVDKKLAIWLFFAGIAFGFAFRLMF